MSTAGSDCQVLTNHLLPVPVSVKILNNMASKLFAVMFLMAFMMESNSVDVPNTPAPTSPPPATAPPLTPIQPPNNGSPPGTCPSTGATISPDVYPNPKRDDTVQDTYGKTVVKDPYRDMENVESKETIKFIAEENAIARPFLDQTPSRAQLQARYEEVYNYPKFTGPFQAGNKFYSFRNTGLQDQDVFYVQDSINCDEAKVFIDPNVLNPKGTTKLSVDYNFFTIDGQILAYLLSDDSSDWATMQFKDVEKGDIYKEKLTKLKFPAVSWMNNKKGLFYSAYLDQKGTGDGTDSEANKNPKLYYHELGTEQDKDVAVAEFPENPDCSIKTAMSDCGKYLIVFASAGWGSNELVYIADLDIIKYEIKTKLELKPIVTKLENSFEFIANNDKTFFFHTNKDADNYKIVSIDIDNPDPKSWKDIVPQNEKDKLEWVYAANKDFMVLGYTSNVRTVLQLHELASGKMLKKFDLEIGAVQAWLFFGDRKYPNIFFNFESFLTPEITYHCDLLQPSFDLKIIHETTLKNVDREKFTSEQVHFKSKDGTEIPMYLVHKKDLQKDGKNPSWMFGYGAFGFSLLPTFSVTRLVFITNYGGVYGAPNIRGGGEKGEAWHRAGQLENKQTSFDDFIAAAEFLIAEKYTNSQLLVTFGSVVGGITVSVCLNQRPDLFGAVIVSGGVFDMLRYEKFTIGNTFVPEYGSASDPKQFEFLYKYSPLHNVKITDTQQYPAILLLTSDHDDDATPIHSYKFIATLQHEAKSHPNQQHPLLLRVAQGAGFSEGASTKREIEDLVDRMCFVEKVLGLKFNAL